MVEKVTEKVLDALFNLIGKECPESLKKSLVQFIKFGIVGVSNTVISYLIYVGTLILLKRLGILSGIDYLVAQVVSFVLSVLWSFYWNNKMVFTLDENQSRNPWKALLKSYITYSFTGLFLNGFLLVLWVRVFHISEFVAPIINLLVSVPLNFLINKFWTFKSADVND